MKKNVSGKSVGEILEEISDPEYFGTLTLKIRRGQITYVTKEETYANDHKTSPEQKQKDFAALTKALSNRPTKEEPNGDIKRQDTTSKQ